MDPKKFVSPEDGLEKYVRLIIYRMWFNDAVDYKRIYFYPLSIKPIQQFCCFKYPYFEFISRSSEEVKLSDFVQDVITKELFNPLLRFDNEEPKYFPTKNLRKDKRKLL